MASGGVGEGRASFEEIEGISGPLSRPRLARCPQPFEIGFNARYLLDVAGQIQGETAEFRFADPASPTLVLDPADPGVRYVLMPLRV